MTPHVSFKVAGLPESKGSWVGIGRGRVRADNPREKAWSDAVGWAAKAAMRGKLILVNGALVALDFTLPPAVGRKNQRDVDKLIRSSLDALTGIVYSDDELVRDVVAHKETTTREPGLMVSVYACPLGCTASDLVRWWLDEQAEWKAGRA